MHGEGGKGMSIARFGHVSEKQYTADLRGATDPMRVEEIPLPCRATEGSAGYDFVAPAETVIPAGGEALIPTGIRAEMDSGWVLMLFPRSSLGFKHGIRLCNTVGVIDSDYAHADNEGHILVKLRNPKDQEVVIRRGDRFCQGVFLPSGTAEEEEKPGKRTGGMGSTGR